MSNKAAYNPSNPTVKQTFTVQTALLDQAKERAAIETGGNLSRYIQTLIERDLAGGTTGGDGSRIIEELAEKWVPADAKKIAAEMSGVEQPKMLALMLSALPRFAYGWGASGDGIGIEVKSGDDVEIPMHLASELVIIPRATASAIERALTETNLESREFYRTEVLNFNDTIPYFLHEGGLSQKEAEAQTEAIINGEFQSFLNSLSGDEMDRLDAEADKLAKESKNTAASEETRASMARLTILLMEMSKRKRNDPAKPVKAKQSK